MSNYHVLELNDKQDRARVAFHITTPTENNSQGVALNFAISQHLAPETVVPWLVDPELTQIQNGEVFEHIETVKFDANLTELQKRSEIDTRFNALNTKIPDIIRTRYRFWGMDRDVS